MTGRSGSPGVVLETWRAGAIRRVALYVRQAPLEYAMLALALSGVLILEVGFVFGVATQILLGDVPRAWLLVSLWEPVMRGGMVLHDYGPLFLCTGMLLFAVRAATGMAGSVPVSPWAALALYGFLALAAGIVLDLTDALLDPAGPAGSW